MPTLTITKSYSDGVVLTESQLDDMRTSIETFINTTKLDQDNIQTGGIASTNLASSSVTTIKIANENVTTAKLANNAVTAEKIADVDSPIIGEVKQFHTFNGTLAVPRGWMSLNGDVVNQTNYDALHGAGAYATDGVASSTILNKNLPDMTSKYPVGAAATTQDGTSAITSVGNSSNQINIAHTHTIPQHNHKWYDDVGSTARAYDVSGNFLAFNSTTGTSGISFNGANQLQGDYWSENHPTSGTDTSGSTLSATQSIQPESIEFIYIMKVI